VGAMPAPSPGSDSTLAPRQETCTSTSSPSGETALLGRRVILECTSTYESRYNTGIQRAVRNLVNASLASTACPGCIAVVYDGRHFVPLDSLPAHGTSHQRRQPSASPVDFLRNAFHRVRARIVRHAPGTAVRDALHSERLEYSLRRLVYAARNGRRWLRSFSRGPTARIEFRRGDVLVLLDSTWSVDLRRELRRAKAAGAHIWVVVNDLIPINHPDLAPEGTPILIAKWLRRTLPYASGLLGISRTVAEEARTYLRQSGLVGNPPKIDHFYLGAGLDGIAADSAEGGAFAAALGHFTGSVYLVVGTIEPRKNHGLILDVFDRLWAEGIDARLVIFGRLGWRSHELEARIRRHSQFGRRLLWLDAGSDSELDYAYRHSSALIFASRCEGFGLPLVEAMQYGLPVLASDIPVFREIGGDYPIYIDTRDHRPLYDAIRGFDAAHAEAPRAQRNPRAWLSWSDSARMLLEKVGVLPAVRS
jgi:O-antigen biosynthesis alpha-1,2-rhamnosyltransferase